MALADRPMTPAMRSLWRQVPPYVDRRKGSLVHVPRRAAASIRMNAIWKVRIRSRQSDRLWLHVDIRSSRMTNQTVTRKTGIRFHVYQLPDHLEGLLHRPALGVLCRRVRTSLGCPLLNVPSIDRFERAIPGAATSALSSMVNREERKVAPNSLPDVSPTYTELRPDRRPIHGECARVYHPPEARPNPGAGSAPDDTGRSRCTPGS